MTRCARATHRGALVALAGLAVVIMASCGEPTAQVIASDESRFRFELPVDFTDLDATEGQAGVLYGRPDASPEQLNADPVFYVATLNSGDAVSFELLRQLFPQASFDPLDPELDPLPDGARLLMYEEITDPEVWGIRMRLLLGRGVFDFQALVDRQSDQVTLSELFCTQACFVEQVDLIDQIQTSWTLGVTA